MSKQENKYLKMLLTISNDNYQRKYIDYVNNKQITIIFPDNNINIPTIIISTVEIFAINNIQLF